MSTAAVCTVLLAATKPLTCAEIAEASSVDRQKVSTVLWALEKAGTVATEKVEGKAQTYAVADQDDAKRRADGKKVGHPKGRRKRAAKAAEKPKKTRRVKKAAKRRTTRKTTRKSAKGAPPSGRSLAFFLGEDGQYQIVRQDGEGEAVFMDALDAKAFADFVLANAR
jgi:hypothetical protein